MNAYSPIVVAPTPLDSIKRVMAAAPHREQIALIRFLAGELSWSRGSDMIDRGADAIEDDLDDEQRAIDARIPTLTPLTTVARQLDPDAWAYAHMEDTFAAPLNQITGRVA